MTEQRFTFDAWAEDYDAYRPGYPDALFADLAEISPPACPILEIGCGTGKATEGLAGLGRLLTAIEPGPAMIEQAKRRVGEAPVEFVNSTFEDLDEDGGPFGLIACAQAWHWVDPEIGFAKASRLLADDGVLAIFGNEDAEVPAVIRSAVDAFRAGMVEMKGVRYGGGVYQRGKAMDRLFSATEAFQTPSHKAYHRTITYTPETYTRLMATYSDVQRQPAQHRAQLLADLHSALSGLGDSFTIEVETHLYWAPARR